MIIDTVGKLVRDTKLAGDETTPLQARYQVYVGMGDYIATASQHIADASRHEGVVRERSRARTSKALGHLVTDIVREAYCALPPEKFNYVLSTYPLVEEGLNTKADEETLREALLHTWGKTDRLIERMSGGLSGSYVQALVTLKPHARALGHDLATAVGMSRKDH